MRIVVAVCSVIYAGRGDTTLAPAARAIIIKDDGAISIHNDKSNKPLNYMGKGNKLTITNHEEHTLWSFDSSKESLQVTLHEVISDTDFQLDIENSPELIREGTESQLQAWLAEHPEALGRGFTFVQREFQTGVGPVDLLLEDENGKPVLVEVKRTASSSSVYQIKKYLDSAQEMPGFEAVRGMIAAVDIRPRTSALSLRRDIECVVIPANWRA